MLKLVLALEAGAGSFILRRRPGLRRENPFNVRHGRWSVTSGVAAIVAEKKTFDQ
jgi:hypothetical protein